MCPNAINSHISHSKFSRIWFQPVFSLALLRYNWRITLRKFKVYNVMVWYMHILQNYYHRKFVNASIILHSNCFFVCIFFSYLYFCAEKIATLFRTFKYTNNIVIYSYYAVNYIPRTYSSYNWKFLPFDHYFPISSPPSLWQPSIYFLFLWVFFFKILYVKWDHPIFVFLGLTYFS